ncbi:hypothetical protein ACFVTY_01910 [Streptomyces sp. NPDC058067]
MNPNWAIALGLAVIAGAIFALQVRRAQATVAAILRTAINESREERKQS